MPEKKVRNKKVIFKGVFITYSFYLKEKKVRF